LIFSETGRDIVAIGHQGVICSSTS